MDHQPLNTAEQKDMAEFFIDLVSKLEEMTPPLKTVVKKLFCGVLSNNVVSLVSFFYLRILHLNLFNSRTVIMLVVHWKNFTQFVVKWQICATYMNLLMKLLLKIL